VGVIDESELISVIEMLRSTRLWSWETSCQN